MKTFSALSFVCLALYSFVAVADNCHKPGNYSPRGGYNQYGSYRYNYNNNRFERNNSLGFRGLAGAAGDEQLLGVGAFLRARGRLLGLEASFDAAQVNVGNQAVDRIQGLAAGMLFFPVSNRARIYGLAGGGLSVEQGDAAALTLQAGGGFELDFNARASLTADVRGLFDQSSNEVAARINASSADVFITGTVGLSFRF